MKKQILLTLVSLGFLSACAVGTPTVTVTDLPETDLPDGSPPPATLEIGGVVQTAGVGTYCWNGQTASGETVNVCADKIGIPTAPDPLKTSSPVTAHLTLPLEESPTQVSLTIFPASDNELPDTVGGYRWWSFIEGFTSMLELQTAQDIHAELEPGTYVFYVFAVWADKGDVSYGFLVEVE